MAKVPQALGSQLTRQYNEPNVGRGTHLTVESSCDIQATHFGNHGRKGGHAREGVNL